MDPGLELEGDEEALGATATDGGGEAPAAELAANAVEVVEGLAKPFTWLCS